MQPDALHYRPLTNMFSRLPRQHRPIRTGPRPGAVILIAAGVLLGGVANSQAADVAETTFHKDVEPILDQYCYDCHGYGSHKGGVSLDEFKTDRGLLDEKLWFRALRNLRASIMPPADKDRPSDQDKEVIARWIKRQVFASDPAQPDPGRVTVRRLNREEYRNTIRDLIGVDFDAQGEFPADDTGHGFDNIADVLTISPLLLEKYLDAAQAIVERAVPTQPRVPADHRLGAADFVATDGPGGVVEGDGLDLSYYEPTTVTATAAITEPGDYRVVVDLRAVERYVDNQFDLNKARLRFAIDGKDLLDREIVREGDKTFQFSYDQTWKSGDHALTFTVEPLTPDAERIRSLRMRVKGVSVIGPLAPEHWVPPPRYEEFFPTPVPPDDAGRRAYAAVRLTDFATRAFRRPVDRPTVERLVDLTMNIAGLPGNTFEAGVAQAMVAVLASPRFLFREEHLEPLRPGEKYPLVDEYALASRLSYFFWSSMPDDELFRLAAAGQLRANLDAQVQRLFNDPRSAKLVRNFTGQWLEARDIGSVAINDLAVFLREHPDPGFNAARQLFQDLQRIPEEQRTPEQTAAMQQARASFIRVFRQPRPDLDYEVREAMRQESEMVFDYVLRQDRDAIELVEADYTFLNEALAKHYGIAGVTGTDMRKVTLPPDSPRGGVLTQGTVLAVTSNPTRTSPVKRGVFILDNILGTAPPPPPPNIPPLDNVSSDAGHELPLRESLAVHAANSMCRSCHNRMDPLGLALENFNALGAWRDNELGQPIDPTGTLITGESFKNVRELKHLLATNHRRDFYRCLSEKLLIYALGRGLDYYDTETVDQLVGRLEAAHGRLPALITGIVASAPFQRSRIPAVEDSGLNPPAADVAAASSPPPPPVPSS